MAILVDSSKWAGSYLRISYNQEGLELGVDRQREDNGKKVAEQGWTVARYVDNDSPGYSGVARPGFEQMVQDVRDRVIDAIVVWNFDQFIRIPSELELLSNVYAAAGAGDGDDDRRSGLGQRRRSFVARAAKESRRKSARIKRKWEQNAKVGLPHEPSRPLGYEPDKTTVQESKARAA